MADAVGEFGEVIAVVEIGCLHDVACGSQLVGESEESIARGETAVPRPQHRSLPRSDLSNSTSGVI
jgi:hypothetical protein